MCYVSLYHVSCTVPCSINQVPHTIRAMYHVPCSVYLVLSNMYHLLCIMYPVPSTINSMYHALCFIYHVRYHSQCTVPCTPGTMYHAPCPIMYVSCIIVLQYILYHVPYAKYHVPRYTFSVPEFQGCSHGTKSSWQDSHHIPGIRRSDQIKHVCFIIVEDFFRFSERTCAKQRLNKRRGLVCI